MKVVTGTKRSGTSMWMQILKIAGYEILGEKFPGRWGSLYRDANPEGFYEDTTLRHGVPPQFPLNDHQALKIFPRGLVKTSELHLGHVIATMRDFQEYESSNRRFWLYEDKVAKERELAPQARYSPVLEWFAHNVTLLQDMVLRGYRVYWVTYDNAVRYPRETTRAVLSWLGVQDPEVWGQAAAQIKASVRTQVADSRLSFDPLPGEVPRGHLPLSLFREMYQRAGRQEIFEPDFVHRVLDAHQALTDCYLRESERSQALHLEARQAYFARKAEKKRRRT